VSGATGAGTRDLVGRIAAAVAAARGEPADAAEASPLA
jgi:hypothetical protein